MFCTKEVRGGGNYTSILIRDKYTNRASVWVDEQENQIIYLSSFVGCLPDSAEIRVRSHNDPTHGGQVDT